MTNLAQDGWRKSSRSDGNNGQCVEVNLGHRFRDSKAPASGVITVSPEAAACFWSALKADAFAS